MSTLKELLKEVGGTRKDILSLPVESLYINPKFDERKSLGDIEDLALSIFQEGFHPNEPIFVRPSKDGNYFEVADGRRRARAAKIAKEKYGWNGQVYATPAPLQMTDKDLIFATLYSNNDRRKPFEPIEEGKYFITLKKEMNVNEEEISKKIGKSITYILDRIAFASLDQEFSKDISTFIEKGQLSITAATKIAKILDKTERESAWNDIKIAHNALKSDLKNDSKDSQKNKKIKCKDIIKAKKGSLEHISIKILKANLKVVKENYEKTNELYWDGAKDVIEAILKGEIIS
jgi:ParB/RepB/Spo0J family partition protein